MPALGAPIAPAGGFESTRPLTGLRSVKYATGRCRSREGVWRSTTNRSVARQHAAGIPPNASEINAAQPIPSCGFSGCRGTSSSAMSPDSGPVSAAVCGARMHRLSRRPVDGALSAPSKLILSSCSAAIRPASLNRSSVPARMNLDVAHRLVGGVSRGLASVGRGVLNLGQRTAHSRQEGAARYRGCLRRRTYTKNPETFGLLARPNDWLGYRRGALER